MNNRPISRALSRSLLPMLAGAVLAFAAGLVLAADPPPPKASPAYANPAFANPDTPGMREGKPAPDVANVTDVVVLKTLVIGNRAETELGKLAAGRSEHGSVDGFGDRMQHDHSAGTRDVTALARSADVEPPAGLDAEHEALKAELSRLQGADFDRRYAGSQVTDHQKTLQLLVHAVGSGQHTGVRDHAAASLPTIAEHLEHARSLYSEVTGAPPATLPSGKATMEADQPQRP